MTNYTIPNQNHVQSAVLRMASQNFTTGSPFTFQQQIINHAGRRWEIDVTLKPMRHSDARTWLAWLAKLDGSLNTFTMSDPLGCNPQGSAGGTPLVAGASQTGSSLNVDGCTTSTTDWLKAGDYIQLGTGADARLHMATDDVDTDGTGAATINIWPPLTSSPADNASVIVSNAVGAFRLSSNVSTWSIDKASVYGINFSGVQVI